MTNLTPLSLPPVITQGVQVKILKPCEQCGKDIPWKADHYSRLRFCGRNCAYAHKASAGKYYKTIIAPDGRRMLEHRYVMEKHSNRRLRTDEHVHHIDGNKRNNVIANLEVLSVAEHTRRHNPKKRLDVGICSWCGTFFTILRSGPIKTCSKKCGRKQSEHKRRTLSDAQIKNILQEGSTGTLYHREIAAKYGVEQPTVSNLLRKHGINGKSHSDRLKPEDRQRYSEFWRGRKTKRL